MAWGPNDVIVTGSPDGLFRFAVSGGARERLTAPDTAKGEVAHRAPLILPDGRTVVFRIELGGNYRASSVWCLWTGLQLAAGGVSATRGWK
jgi:hypothetical protein